MYNCHWVSGEVIEQSWLLFWNIKTLIGHSGTSWNLYSLSRLNTLQRKQQHCWNYNLSQTHFWKLIVISQAVEMKERFQHRGYPTASISSAYQRALYTDMEFQLRKQELSPIPHGPLYPLAGRIKNISLKHRKVLKRDPSLNDIGSEPPLIT